MVEVLDHPLRHLFEFRQVLGDDVPDDGVADRVVLVPKDIPDPGHLLPVRIRVGALQIRRDVTAGLGDDLEDSLACKAEQPVGPVLERLPGYGSPNAGDRLCRVVKRAAKPSSIRTRVRLRR